MPNTTSSIAAPTTAETITTPTTTIIPTTIGDTASQVSCNVAIGVSSTLFILTCVLFGALLCFYYKKKKHFTSTRTVNEESNLTLKKVPKDQTSNTNAGFKSEDRYSSSPKRPEPLPIKKRGKTDVSPYHASLRDHEEYSIPPQKTNSFIKPPLPPNLAEKKKAQQEEEDSSPYYLDMECVKDEMYQNYPPGDDIYINN